MLWAALLALLLGFAVGAWRTRRTVGDLERRLEVTRRELEFLQRAFSRFAPAQVVEDIVAQGVSAASQKKEVTVLFADLKGFTALSERLPAAELVDILNGYLERMDAVIVEHRGHVSELVGDGILALFGALAANPWQTNDAVHAALAMRATLTDHNRSLAAAGRPTLGIGVGIHRGPVVAGLIGTTGLMKYGVIGLTINLAARVERLTRVHDVDILVTEAVRAALDPRFGLRAMPAVAVKGIAGELVTFAVEGFDAGDGGPRPAGYSLP
jgi:class 3 adenylate cyclase